MLTQLWRLATFFIIYFFYNTKILISAKVSNFPKNEQKLTKTLGKGLHNWDTLVLMEDNEL